MFAKVFTQIFDSSIAENYLTRLVFTDMLTLCDLNGVVDMTHEAIARRTNVPIEHVRAAIEELESPDTKSRTPDHEGRRLVRLDEHRDWGWEIVNYQRFRDIASEEQRREKTKIRTRKWRNKTPGDAPVTPGDARDAMQREREMHKENAQQTNRTKTLPSIEEAVAYGERIGMLPAESEKFWHHFESMGWIDKNGNPIQKWQSKLVTWKTETAQRKEKYHGNNGTISRPNPRNAGIIHAPNRPTPLQTAQRKLRQQDEARALAEAQYAAQNAAREAAKTSE